MNFKLFQSDFEYHIELNRSILYKIKHLMSINWINVFLKVIIYDFEYSLTKYFSNLKY